MCPRSLDSGRRALLLAAVSASIACAPGVRAQAGIGFGVAPRPRQQVVLGPGETLWRVARRFGITADELARENGIADPTRVRAGTVLTVPAPAGSLPERPPALAMREDDSAARPVAAPPAPGPSTGAPQSRAAADSETHAAATRLQSARASAPAPAPAATEDPGEAATARTATEGTSSRLHAEPRGSHPSDDDGHPSSAAGGADSTERGSSSPLRWPLDGKVVARFGPREGSTHDGIDIAARPGTEIHAAAAGKVIFAGRHGGYGNLVILRHESGLLTVYARTAVNLVRRGQHVAVGQVIARVASPPDGATAQLHFEVREGVDAKNPLKYLSP